MRGKIVTILLTLSMFITVVLIGYTVVTLSSQPHPKSITKSTDKECLYIGWKEEPYVSLYNEWGEGDKYLVLNQEFHKEHSVGDFALFDTKKVQMRGGHMKIDAVKYVGKCGGFKYEEKI